MTTSYIQNALLDPEAKKVLEAIRAEVLASADDTVAASLSTFGGQVVVDLTAIRGAVVGITAKLDADLGVTDTDYASTLDPAVLTAVAP